MKSVKAQGSEWWKDGNDRKWSSLLRHTPSLIVAIDLEKRIRFVNHERLFGKEYSLGDNILDYAKNENREKMAVVIDHVLDTGETMEFESEVVGVHSAKTHNSNQLAPIVEDGLIHGLTIMTTDITEQVKGIVELEFAKERLEEAQQVAKIGSWQWDIADGTIWWSDELYKLYGLKREDVNPTYKKFMSKVHPDDRCKVLKSIEQAVRYDKPFTVEFRLLFTHSSMMHLHALAQVLNDSDGNPIFLRGIIQDITDRKLVDIELEKSSAGLAEAQRIAHIGNWDWDVETDQTYWSDEIYRIFGHEPQSYPPSSKAYLDPVHPGDLEEVMMAANRVVKNKEPYDLVHRIVLPNGQVRYVSNVTEVFVDKNDNLVRIVGTVQDITERKKAQVELSIANKLLLSQSKREHRLKSRALIIGMEKERARVSRELHDGIGQMLSAIKFSVGYLHKTEGLNEHHAEAIGEIKDLIDMSIAETIEMSNNLMPNDLRDFGLKPAMQNTINDHSKEIQTKITFKCAEIEHRLPSEIETGLYRITQESVNNAVKYAKAKEILIQVDKTEKSLKLQITDDGCGFDLKPKTKRKADPRNGLINMKERVVMMGGRFKIISKVGTGTKVMVEIPLEED